MTKDNLLRGMNKLKEAFRILKAGPMEHYLSQLLEQREMLFERSPFQVGDRVELIEAEDGPRGHFLKPGFPATVQKVNTQNKNFICGVVFDDEAWIDNEGKKHPATMKHTFFFTADKLRTIYES